MLEIHIIVIDPKFPGNVGAIARVMKNFDFKNLKIVNSNKIILKNNESYARAKHGKNILEEAEIYNSFYEFQDRNKYDFLIGTTAQPGGSYNPLRLIISPREACKNININGRIGILFGREDSGLTNKELELCDSVISIPAGSYSTLNISHAVAIILYEIFTWKNTLGKKVIYKEANLEHKKNLLIRFQNILNFLHAKINKFNEKHVSDTQRIFKNLIGRAFISEREANTLGRIFRYIDESLQGIWKERT